MSSPSTSSLGPSLCCRHGRRPAVMLSLVAVARAFAAKARANLASNPFPPLLGPSMGASLSPSVGLSGYGEKKMVEGAACSCVLPCLGLLGGRRRHNRVTCSAVSWRCQGVAVTLQRRVLMGGVYRFLNISKANSPYAWSRCRRRRPSRRSQPHGTAAMSNGDLGDLFLNLWDASSAYDR